MNFTESFAVRPCVVKVTTAGVAIVIVAVPIVSSELAESRATHFVVILASGAPAIAILST